MMMETDKLYQEYLDLGAYLQVSEYHAEVPAITNPWKDYGPIIAMPKFTTECMTWSLFSKKLSPMPETAPEARSELQHTFITWWVIGWLLQLSMKLTILGDLEPYLMTVIIGHFKDSDTNPSRLALERFIAENFGGEIEKAVKFWNLVQGTLSELGVGGAVGSFIQRLHIGAPPGRFIFEMANNLRRVPIVLSWLGLRNPFPSPEGLINRCVGLWSDESPIAKDVGARFRLTSLTASDVDRIFETRFWFNVGALPSRPRVYKIYMVLKTPDGTKEIELDINNLQFSSVTFRELKFPYGLEVYYEVTIADIGREEYDSIRRVLSETGKEMFGLRFVYGTERVGTKSGPGPSGVFSFDDGAGWNGTVPFYDRAARRPKMGPVPIVGSSELVDPASVVRLFVGNTGSHKAGLF